MKIDNKTVGIIGLITMLAVLGGNFYLSSEQLDNAYFCTASEEIGIFYGGISKTGLTAYPYTENRTDYERCQKAGIKGVWIPLIEYAEENGIDSLEIINQKSKLDLENNTKIVTINYPDATYECIFTNKFINGALESSSICERI